MSKKACVLVCVTSQPDCERLIRAGKKIADGEGVPLQVVSVQRMEECFQPNSDTLERLHQQAKAVNAEMTIYFNDSPAITAAVHAVKEGAVNIVMGSRGKQRAFCRRCSLAGTGGADQHGGW